MLISTSQIASITGGSLSGPGDVMVEEMLTDSRKASSISGRALFIATTGKQNDGHSYIQSLYRQGVRAFLVEKELQQGEMPAGDAAIITTGGSVKALQEIALHLRNNFNGTLVAITGSAGKTIVKEWLSEILGLAGPVVRSPRSYNSQTGVPLSLCRLDKHYKYAVIEAGMSQPGEIALLERITRPDIGVLTNIGQAHQENFSSLEEKVREKLTLFKNCKILVYCADHDIIVREIEEGGEMKGTTLFSWSSSKDKNAEVHIIHGEGSDGKTPVVILHGGDETECIIPFTDKASIENASSAIATALCLNLDLKEIAKRVAGLQSVAMRMEKKAAINDSVLIEDFYNSDPGSLGMALDHLKELEYAKKTLIISDFIQSGRDATSLAREIVTLSERAGVSRFLCIGKELGKSHDIFPPGSLFFERTDNFIDWFSQEYFDGEAILLKGARIFGFEHISRLLELKVHATRLEINLNRVLSNLNYYRSKLKKDTRIMAMIKAFAYGTGSKEIASWLNFNGIDFLAVACTDEGIELRNAGVTNRVMVMSPDPWSFRTMIEYDLEPELFSNSMIRSFISEADSYGLVNYPVHIKLDTGMHRLGLAEEDLPETVKMIIESDNIKLASVFSHLGSSDRPEHDDLTLLQAERFINMCEYVSAHTGSTFLRHLLNSSGIERFPDLQFDMVRLGIGLYFTGIENVAGDDPAVVFKTTIAQVKKVKAGEGIGYGFTDISDHDRMIAVVPVGYADGLSRRLGGGNFSMYTAGKKVPTAGRICMDMCMLDVTSVDVNPGDEVEIFGRYISLNDIAEANETIPHEILSGIPPRVKRVFLYE